MEAANYKKTLVAEPLEQLEKHEMLGEFKRDIYEHAQKLVSDFEALAQRDATQCEQY